MQDNFQKFLDQVCSCIDWREAHEEVRQELASHLEERAEYYEEQGTGAGEAATLAVRDMGSGEEIGLALDRQHQPQIEWKLIGLTAVLGLFGMMLMLCAQKSGFGGNPYFGKYIAGLVLGVVAAGWLMHFQYKRLLRHSVSLFVVMLLLQQAYIIYCRMTMGWTGVLDELITPAFQEKYFCFVLIPLAGILYQYRGGGWTELLRWIGLCGLVLIVGIQYPTISGLFLFIICAAVLLFTAVWKGNFRGSRRRYFIGIGLLGTGLASGCLWIMWRFLSDQRFHSFFAAGHGVYGFDQAVQWRSEAALFGGNPMIQGYMEPGMDLGIKGIDEFVLTGIIASLGWAAGIALLFVVSLFLVRLLRTVWGIRDGYGYYLSMCCGIILAAKFAINVMINFGLFPAYSIGMPFVSRGSVDFVQNMIFIGLILSVWRRNSLSLVSEEKISREDKKMDKAI